jgi:hypothetical protein
MALATWLHLVHVLGAVIWIGGGLMLSLVGARIRASNDPRLIGVFARMLSYTGLRVFMPAVLVVLVSGVWLVLIRSAQLFTQLWVLLAIAAFIAAFLVGAVYLSRIAIRLERLAGSDSLDIGTARDLLGRWLGGYYVVLAILLFALWDMVFKPA